MLRDNLAGLIETDHGQRGNNHSRAAAILQDFIVHVTKHRTIDPACLENLRPEGAESGEHRFAISSQAQILFFGKWWDTQAFTYTGKYPIPGRRYRRTLQPAPLHQGI